MEMDRLGGGTNECSESITKASTGVQFTRPKFPPEKLLENPLEFNPKLKPFFKKIAIHKEL